MVSVTAVFSLVQFDRLMFDRNIGIQQYNSIGIVDFVIWCDDGFTAVTPSLYAVYTSKGVLLPSCLYDSLTNLDSEDSNSNASTRAPRATAHPDVRII